jgi:hypothetical protein
MVHFELAFINREPGKKPKLSQTIILLIDNNSKGRAGVESFGSDCLATGALA